MAQTQILPVLRNIANHNFTEKQYKQEGGGAYYVYTKPSATPTHYNIVFAIEKSDVDYFFNQNLGQTPFKLNIIESVKYLYPARPKYSQLIVNNQNIGKSTDKIPWLQQPDYNFVFYEIYIYNFDNPTENYFYYKITIPAIRVIDSQHIVFNYQGSQFIITIPIRFGYSLQLSMPKLYDHPLINGGQSGDTITIDGNKVNDIFALIPQKLIIRGSNRNNPTDVQLVKTQEGYEGFDPLTNFDTRKPYIMRITMANKRYETTGIASNLL